MIGMRLQMLRRTEIDLCKMSNHIAQTKVACCMPSHELAGRGRHAS